jgi:hypothetical protein
MSHDHSSPSKDFLHQATSKNSSTRNSGVTSCAVVDMDPAFNKWPREPGALEKATLITVLPYVADWTLSLAPVIFIGKLPGMCLVRDSGLLLTRVL